ncbi:hypothetical protein [Phenylobacterium sp.]|uniref:hypothetical protein n=1 Tax=Phenylobacterium sp. TaxID=1871053 RepID=UPI00391A8C8F
MIRSTSLAALALLVSTPIVPGGAAAAERCQVYGAADTTLKGKVYAFEAFTDEEGSIMRERKTDYYALVLPDRICVADRATALTEAPDFRVTIVRLDVPAREVKGLLQKTVEATGPLSRAEGEEPEVAMKVWKLTPVP